MNNFNQSNGANCNSNNSLKNDLNNAQRKSQFQSNPSASLEESKTSNPLLNKFNFGQSSASSGSQLDIMSLKAFTQNQQTQNQFKSPLPKAPMKNPFVTGPQGNGEQQANKENQTRKSGNKANDLQQVQAQMARLKLLTFYQEKRREEVWARAFETLGLKKDLLKSLRREEIEQKYEPFKSANVKKIGYGNFNQVKIPKLVVEIQFIENVGQCYQVKLKDLVGDLIEATFHTNCKELFQKQMRKGRVLILQDVAVFSLSQRTHYLIVLVDCVTSIVK